MSFGFSVGDIIAVGNIAWDVYQKVKSAGVEFDELGRKVEKFGSIIERIETINSTPSPGNHQTPLQQEHHQGLCEMFKVEIADSKKSLKEIDVIMTEYACLKPEERTISIGMRFWKKLKFASSSGTLEKWESDLALHTDKLELLLLMRGDDQISLAVQKVEELGSKLDDLLTSRVPWHTRRMSQKEGSVSSDEESLIGLAKTEGGRKPSLETRGPSSTTFYPPIPEERYPSNDDLSNQSGASNTSDESSVCPHGIVKAPEAGIGSVRLLHKLAIDTRETLQHSRNEWLAGLAEALKVVPPLSPLSGNQQTIHSDSRTMAVETSNFDPGLGAAHVLRRMPSSAGLRSEDNDSKYDVAKYTGSGLNKAEANYQAEEDAKLPQPPNKFESECTQCNDRAVFRTHIRARQFIATFMAVGATIHAAHNVYQSIEMRDARHQAVTDGVLSPEEARKLKAKGMLQDLASLGIAAVGCINAIRKWRELGKESKRLDDSDEGSARESERESIDQPVHEASRDSLVQYLVDL